MRINNSSNRVIPFLSGNNKEKAPNTIKELLSQLIFARLNPSAAAVTACSSPARAVGYMLAMLP